MVKTITYFVVILLLVSSCQSVNAPQKEDIVEKKELIDEHVEVNIPRLISYASDNRGRINDSTILVNLSQTEHFYSANENKPIWSDDGRWKPYTSAMLGFLSGSLKYGLFPSDYYYRQLQTITSQFMHDSVASRNAVLWGTADLLLTDAFFRICHDLKVGRLPMDSLSVKKDSVLTDSFYTGLLNQFIRTGNIEEIVATLEPRHAGYLALKESLPSFLDSANFRRFTYINYPASDSLKLYQQLQQRFFELDLVKSAHEPIDTVHWKKLIGAYQGANKLKVTGKLNESVVNKLNSTDWERMKQIALTMDKFKQLPDTLPARYVWVNIPSYRLRIMDFDILAVESRVIVGAPATRTPELVSEISNFITYPQWTVPYSIIFKEMLPKIQKDVDYLVKQNLMVVDRNDSIIDPHTIDWSKLSKNHFPYLLKQRQGDDNSLGVIKFNFRNKYSVYLHDTNARGLFQKSSRALSHGCVRVQQWKPIAHYLIRNDTVLHPVDTLVSYLERKEKKVIYGFERIPIFIRYFTCEGVEGRIQFYEDVYGTDKYLREKYFSNKSIISMP